MFILVRKTDRYLEGIATGASEAVKVSVSELIENSVITSESDASDFELFGLLISFSTSSIGINGLARPSLTRLFHSLSLT